MTGNAFLRFNYGLPVSCGDVPCLNVADLHAAIAQAVQGGCRLIAYFGYPCRAGQIELLAILADDAHGVLFAATARPGPSGTHYPALTPACPQAHWFEREIAEQWALVPEGHPWLKPIRFHGPWISAMRAGSPPPLPGVVDYYRVEGEAVHEVAVGPVHAGIIEPGHFRFQCYGENVLHLEIELGYQHRGIERRLQGGPDNKTIHYVETAAGDSTIAHTTAYCHNLEMLAGLPVSPAAHILRGVALELERLANHTGDLGALAGDVGFLPTAAYCGRIRGEWLNMTAMLCGNRFGRGFVLPGGVAYYPPSKIRDDLSGRVAAALRDTAGAVDLLWRTGSVMARFEETGRLDKAAADAIGLVGPAARASGILRDVRQDFPSGIFCYAQIPISSWTSGDVFARALVRWLEIERSAAFIREQLAQAFDNVQDAPPVLPPLKPETISVALVEGWRGEVCHVAITDPRGAFAHYKIVDPSFHNWFGLALAMRGEQISDFPLCNKSFNLSYCGHDL